MAAVEALGLRLLSNAAPSPALLAQAACRCGPVPAAGSIAVVRQAVAAARDALAGATRTFPTGAPAFIARELDDLRHAWRQSAAASA